MATSASSISGGSTLDVQTLASQLVAAERAPLDAQIKRETAGVKTTLSALGTLKSALSTFQAVVDNMSMLADFQVRSAMSSKPEVFSASAGSGAVPGTYGIEVRQLAAAHSIASGAYAGGSAALVGSGRVALSGGDSAFSMREMMAAKPGSNGVPVKPTRSARLRYSEQASVTDKPASFSALSGMCSSFHTVVRSRFSSTSGKPTSCRAARSRHTVRWVT